MSDCEKHTKITRKHSDRQHSRHFWKFALRHRLEGGFVYVTQFTQFTQLTQLSFKNEINFKKCLWLVLSGWVEWVFWVFSWISLNFTRNHINFTTHHHTYTHSRATHTRTHGRRCVWLWNFNEFSMKTRDKQHSRLFLKFRVRHRVEGVFVYATQFTQFTQLTQLSFKN